MASPRCGPRPGPFGPRGPGEGGAWFTGLAAGTCPPRRGARRSSPWGRVGPVAEVRVTLRTSGLRRHVGAPRSRASLPMRGRGRRRGAHDGSVHACVDDGPPSPWVAPRPSEATGRASKAPVASGRPGGRAKPHPPPRPSERCRLPPSAPPAPGPPWGPRRREGKPQGGKEQPPRPPASMAGRRGTGAKGGPGRTVRTRRPEPPPSGAVALQHARNDGSREEGRPPTGTPSLETKGAQPDRSIPAAPLRRPKPWARARPPSPGARAVAAMNHGLGAPEGTELGPLDAPVAPPVGAREDPEGEGRGAGGRRPSQGGDGDAWVRH